MLAKLIVQYLSGFFVLDTEKFVSNAWTNAKVTPVFWHKRRNNIQHEWRLGCFRLPYSNRTTLVLSSRSNWKMLWVFNAELFSKKLWSWNAFDYFKFSKIGDFLFAFNFPSISTVTRIHCLPHLTKQSEIFQLCHWTHARYQYWVVSCHCWERKEK